MNSLKQCDNNIFSVNSEQRNKNIHAYTVSDDTLKGQIRFEDDFRLAYLHDTQESFENSVHSNSIVALFDNRGLVDYNKIVIKPNSQDEKQLDIKLV